jgi:hypothetical protein
MPHIVKISQRRKGSGAQVRFQSRSFIDSDTSEKVDGMRRIRWTAWIGFGGRHASDYARNDTPRNEIILLFRQRAATENRARAVVGGVCSARVSL